VSLATTHLFWITSRGAGLAALLLASLSVSVGACIHLAKGRGADLRTLHETLSLGALLSLVVHGAALLGDGWLHPGLVGVTVPFVGAYRPLWTGLGIIAGYGLAALGLSYYLRARIGTRRWKAAHRFIVVFWALGIVHSLGSGTDAGQPWFLIALAITILPALAPLALRQTGLVARRARPAAQPNP
jgi:sulfoxide reductase heme-binding subunit YedZ